MRDDGVQSLRSSSRLGDDGAGRSASRAKATPAGSPVHTVRVDASRDRAVHSFRPQRALGAGVDRLSTSATEKLFAPPFLERILEAGWQTVSYRQNTELYVEAWHWNPQGTWSDPAGRGYFTGNAAPAEPIRHSFGYFLPHRGVTRNDGANSGYSRLTDGDLETYWKSNPYLSHAFTGEEDSAHPQWLVIDLATTQAVNAIRIAWAEPYARRYLVQYWSAEDSAKDPIKAPTQGVWRTFPGGAVTSGAGGTVTLPLAPSPTPVRFLRIWMTESSDTCDTHGDGDRRNCVGYAVRELYLGTLRPEGGLFDLVRHTPDQDQTTTVCSSVDPWHAPADINDKRDQVGFDLFFTSALTRGLPTMVPVSMLYGTPEDSAAEIAYLKKRGYPLSYVEMGEEPDGQFMLPEDYGTLYLQWADALHRVDPALKLGGPVFEGVNQDIEVWPDALGRTSWLRRFLDYLRDRGRLADFSFFSFEHYPYEPCRIQWSSLYDEPKLIGHILQVWRDAGLPPGTPLFVTESNISWQSAENSVDIFGGSLARGLHWRLLHGGRRRQLLLPLHSHRPPPRLQRLAGDLRHVHRGRRPPHPAADVPVLRQPDSEPGLGRARGRRAPRLSRDQRRPGPRRQRPRHRLCAAASGRTVVGAADQQGPDPPPFRFHRFPRRGIVPGRLLRGARVPDHVRERAVPMASGGEGGMGRS